MTGTHKVRVSMAAHGLINECRYSGMKDVDWCRENDIAVNIFTTGSTIVGKRQRSRI